MSRSVPFTRAPVRSMIRRFRSARGAASLLVAIVLVVSCRCGSGSADAESYNWPPPSGRSCPRPGLPPEVVHLLEDLEAPGCQISPPGARAKRGGWRLLTTSLSEARAAVEHPNGPGVWCALADVLEAVSSGAWKGLPDLYYRASEPGASSSSSRTNG